MDVKTNILVGSTTNSIGIISLIKPDPKVNLPLLLFDPELKEEDLTALPCSSLLRSRNERPQPAFKTFPASLSV